MSIAKNKLMDDDLDSSSENDEKEEPTNGNCNKIMMPLNLINPMPLNLINPRRRLVDDNLDSSASSDSESESESESEIGNDIAPGPSTSVKISELKDCNLSEKDKDDHHENDNDSITIISKIDVKTTVGENSTLSSTDSDSDCGGPSGNFVDSDLDELEDKKYRPKQSKQSKTKKKSKKKTQKSGTGSNKNNDKNPNQHSEDDEIEIKSNVPLSSTVSNSGRKNSQSRRSANQKPRQYRRERTDRNVSTQKPPKIPNIPHPHGHVEVKRVTANDAIDILERMKARLAMDSDQESDNKKTGSSGSGAKGARTRPGGGKEICSVLVIRKKPEYCSD